MMKKSRSSKTSGLKHFFKLSILCNHMPPHKMQKKKNQFGASEAWARYFYRLLNHCTAIINFQIRRYSISCID
jgi:hypothetical protein